MGTSQQDPTGFVILVMAKVCGYFFLAHRCHRRSWIVNIVIALIKSSRAYMRPSSKVSVPLCFVLPLRLRAMSLNREARQSGSWDVGRGQDLAFQFLRILATTGKPMESSIKLNG